MVVVVCDGAGSASQADEGARIAATRACDLTAALTPPLDEGIWRDTFRAVVLGVRDAIDLRAGELGVPPRELATTLLVAVVGETGALVGQLGDGAVVLRSGTDLMCPTRPPVGEHPNETVFVTGSLDEIDASLSTAVLEEAVDGIAAFTDGIERLALRMVDRMPHPPFLEPLFRFVEEHGEGAAAELERFLGSSRVRSRTDDDCSLVIAVAPSARR